MKAVVMAGGQGTRLRPLTSNLPKPMLPVGNVPTAQHILNHLARHGLTEVVMTTAFLPQLIRNYFGDGSSLGMDIAYSVEETPLGTAGSVKNARDLLDDTFLVISGDALTDIDLTALVNFHHERDALVTIALVSVENPLEFGVIIVDEELRIQQFLEKPGWGQVFSDTVNTGIYVLEPEVLDHVPDGIAYDFSHDLFPSLHARGLALYGMPAAGYWQDIGTLEQYVRANRDAMDGLVRLDLPGVRLRGNVWVGQGVSLDSLDNVEGPAVIGNYAKIDPTAVIGSYTVLGNNAVLRPGARITGSILGEGCYLGEGSRVRSAILANSVDLRAGAVVSEGAVVGEQCSIGENAIIGNDVKIYPFKRVEPGAAIRSSLVSQTRGATALFGKHGVRGLVNVDVTPERAMRLAMSYGTLLRKDAYVTASRDAHPSSRMLKRAVIAGLTSTGVSVRDLEVAPLAVNRFDLKNGRASGGIHVCISPHHPEEVEIVFSEPPGLPVSAKTERSIENYYQREDFRRAFYDEMGAIVYPAHTLEMYLDSVLAELDAEAIRRSGFRMVADYSHSAGSQVMNTLLERLGVEVMALNAFTGPVHRFRLDKHLPEAEEKVARLVGVMEADLGVILEPSAEQIFVLDEDGTKLDENELLLLLMNHECLERGPGEIVLPQQATRLAEEVAEKCGASVRRTRSSEAVLLRESADAHVIFAATAEGGYVFPRFLPSQDAFMTLGKILETMARAAQPLSRLTAVLPPVHVVHEVVCCPWHAKGAAMRIMVEELRHEAISLVDGIKVALGGGDWVQILPDADEPLFHVYAEGSSDAGARSLLEEYAARLEQVVFRAQNSSRDLF
ncbi:MAG: mannose-1-phosphate guanyltransferase [Thermoleophilia bacterium]